MIYNSASEARGDMLNHINDAFKQGRRAGHEDVAKEILKHSPATAHETARAFLALYEPQLEPNDDIDTDDPSDEECECGEDTCVCEQPSD